MVEPPTPDDVSPFEKLIGRAATNTEREQLRRVKDALGLGDNDALWLIIFALQWYESLYRQFPGAIAKEAASVMARARETADAELRAGVAQAQADLARAVAIAAQDVARPKATQWLIYGMALGAALVIVGIAIGRALPA